MHVAISASSRGRIVLALAAALAGGLAVAASRSGPEAAPPDEPVFTRMCPSPEAEQEPPSSEPPLVIVAVATSKTIGPDDPLPLVAYAVNRTNRPLMVLRSLDASDVGWRYPKIDLEIRDARGQLVGGAPGGRCGLVNPLTASDFVELAPGGQVDLLGEGTFGHHRLRAPNGLAPGVYTVTVRYDVQFDQAERATHNDVAPQLAVLPKGLYVSQPLVIEVR